ncbi:MAG: response regulator [Daejeonella sp.]
MKKQILVVDDDLTISKLINFILSNDYEIVVKENGADAIKWLEEGNDPALIISDLEMPYIDGAALIRNLKTNIFYKNTPVFLISGADNLDLIVQGMPFQADCFFKKPFNPTELKSSVTAMLTE